MENSSETQELLATLKEKREKHLQSCRENKDGSHQIIADLYSDNYHFIYELLQNADDACAKKVTFKLQEQALFFTHDGAKLFNYNDVDSITTVFNSTKKDDINAIGKFGAGFKSVYNITDSPIIHSGNWHFKIENLIVPQPVAAKELEKNTTEIILPFKEQDAEAETVENISEILQNLAAESLLFLHNIKEIKWQTAEDSGHYLVEHQGQKANLIRQINTEDEIEEYYLFSKEITVADKSLKIMLAYLLAEGKIVPISEAAIFVFFPTEIKEGFNFLVHAPYKTTPNRENIPLADKDNKIITEELALLIAESIIELKELNLLDVNFLAEVLPIVSYNSQELYKAAFEKIKPLFSENLLLPNSNGGYDYSGDILAGTKNLNDLLNEEDRLKLFAKKSFLSVDITENKTRELWNYLKEHLDIESVTNEDLIKKLDKEFIEAKSDEWLLKFYDAQPNYYRPKEVFKFCPIIRLTNNSNVYPYKDNGEPAVYLPLPADKGESKFPTIKREIAEQAKDFLKKLGLQEPDAIAELKGLILSKYKNGTGPELREHLEDFKRVFTIYQEADEHKEKKIIDLLKEPDKKYKHKNIIDVERFLNKPKVKPVRFIRCQQQDGNFIYNYPQKIYFVTENLSMWFAENNSAEYYFLAPYLEEKWQEFLKELGVTSELLASNNEAIEKHDHGDHSRSVDGFNPAYNINGLEFALENITIERSQYLWKFLLKNYKKLKGYIESTTNENQKSYEKGEELESKAKELLDEYYWLYNCEGELIELDTWEITLEDLHEDYEKKHDNVEKLIEVLGFKLDKIVAFEKATGLKVVPEEKLAAFAEWEAQQKLAEERAELAENKVAEITEEQRQEDSWAPEVAADEVTLRVEQFMPAKNSHRDLAGQSVTEIKNNGQNNNNSLENNNKTPSIPDENKAKEIGLWGEKLAEQHLKKEFPADSGDEVLWLNDRGNVGKGYDFRIEKNGADLFYYEVKTTKDNNPRLFEVSGTQWNWAKDLHKQGKGDMHIILRVINAGTKDAEIIEIKNPVQLWQEGELEADPVNIKL